MSEIAKGLYQGYVSQASKDFGVPKDIINAVIQQESGWNRAAVGTSGEKGLMQIMPGTGRDLGLTDFFNPEANIRAGAKYLSQQYQRFGNWREALQAYNAGAGNIKAGAGYADKVLGRIDPTSVQTPLTKVVSDDPKKVSDESVVAPPDARSWSDKVGDAADSISQFPDRVKNFLQDSAQNVMLSLLAILLIIFGVWRLVNA